MMTTTRFFFMLLACCAFLAAGTQQTAAQCAPGQTEVTITITPGSFPAELVWDLVDNVTATVVASRTCGTAGGSTQNICLNDGQTYTFNARDDWGDGWNGATFNIAKTVGGCAIASGSPNNLTAGDNTDNCVGFQLEQSVTFQTDAPIAGCTNPAASNFNPCATIDNGSCIVPAPNNACADAIDIANGTCYVGSNVGATAGDGPLGVACVDGSLTPADIWFTTTIGASGAVNITVADNPGFSSIFELYLGTCGSLGTGILASLGACSNYGDGGGITLSGLPAGAELVIRFWDFGSNDFNALTLCVEEPIAGCTDPCASNYNPAASIDDGSCTLPATDADDCASAAAVSAGVTPFYSEGATGSDISSCTGNDSLDIWFAYSVPVGIDSVLIYTCGSSFDTGLSLWDACGGNEIACNDDATPAGGSLCGGSNFQSYILLTDSALTDVEGSTIYIRIAGFNGSSGCGDLNIEELGTPPFVCVEPQNPVSTLTPAGVTLSWDATPGVLAYRVTGGPVGGPYVNRTSGTNSKNIPNSALNAGTCYEWSVRAKCVDNSVSGYSSMSGFCIPVARMDGTADVQLFPNPADQQTVLSFSADADEAMTVQVYDLSGKLMMTESLNATAGANNYSLNTAQLADGSYLVQLMGETRNFAMMVDVKH
ncbi:MAG: T9SS type A sorting domain-containing protein [Bacteroidetes bacterium]|nr:T9SS type A sorting domain-containing protein [Bacteroidota bacterium]